MIYFVLFLLGLCFGSFVNALVWRVHKQESSKSKSKYSIIKGRSMCPNCKHELAAKDLVPVFSWILLKGRCRYCGKPISGQYPFVEVLTALLFVLSYIIWPQSLTTSYLIIAFITWLIILIGLIALAVYDIRWMILPDRIVYPLVIIVIISAVTQFIVGRPLDEVFGMCLSALIGGGVFWILYQISNGKWIGGGDVKLGFLLGLVVAEPILAILCIFMASLFGMIWVTPLLITKKANKTSKIPFGPFLIAACIFVVLYGQSLISWYKAVMFIG